MEINAVYLRLFILVIGTLTFAVRYHSEPVGSDEGLWLLWPMTGARPGRDYIGGNWGYPAYMKAWSYIVGRNIPRLKFIHHMTMGALAIAAYAMTGELSVGLMALIMVQAAQFKAYQSWYDAASAGLSLLVVLAVQNGQPLLAMVLLAIGCFIHVKTVFAGLAFILWGEWIGLAYGAGMLAVIALVLLVTNVHREFWYEYVTLSRAVTRYRRSMFKFWIGSSLYDSAGYAVLLVVGAMLTAQAWDWRVVAMGAAYVAITASGRLWRSNHFMGLVVLAALVPDQTLMTLILLAMQFAWLFPISDNHGKLIIRDSWVTTYTSFATVVHEARIVGQLLTDMELSEDIRVFVNSFLIQIYCYAQVKPPYFVADEIEIRDAAVEKRTLRNEQLAARPPHLIVWAADFPCVEIQGQTREVWRGQHLAILELVGVPIASNGQPRGH